MEFEFWSARARALLYLHQMPSVNSGKLAAHTLRAGRPITSGDHPLIQIGCTHRNPAAGLRHIILPAISPGIKDFVSG